MAFELDESQALHLWHSAAMMQVLDNVPDLTLRQTAILLTIYLERPPHTVRGLAAKLNVTKPVITRALDTMGIMKLVTRKRDPRDRRNVIIQRTVEGSLYLEKLAEIIAGSAAELQQ
ncbi:MAG: MarR family transcriptional regulator [Rhizobiaceae bacterium]|nr:MarR family transcriptional regulator [Rhizobiaceae bacterium]